MKAIEKTEENKSVLLNNRNTCDKYDILIALGAGAIAYKAGGGDLISGGEKSAKEMEFS